MHLTMCRCKPEISLDDAARLLYIVEDSLYATARVLGANLLLSFWYLYYFQCCDLNLEPPYLVVNDVPRSNVDGQLSH